MPPHPSVGPVVMPELFRSDALVADLQALGAAPAPPLAQATRQYVERLGEISATDPGLLVAHAYVRYLGDLNGGQALRRVVARSLGAGGRREHELLRLRRRAPRGSGWNKAFVPDWKARRHTSRTCRRWPTRRLDAFERHEQLFEELSATA